MLLSWIQRDRSACVDASNVDAGHAKVKAELAVPLAVLENRKSDVCSARIGGTLHAVRKSSEVTMMSRSPFGDELRRRRRETGLTQEQLAELSGISIRAITDIERGVVERPHVDTLRLLAGALELAPDDTREWLNLRQAPSSLPRQDSTNVSSLPDIPNRLIGRDESVDELIGLLRDPSIKLVNLTGPGGIGKTRVAVEAARRVAPEFQDGVLFVDLAPLQHAESVLPAIAEKIHVRGADRITMIDSISNHLQRRSVLLVLDNFEHLLAAAPEIAGLIKRDSQATILVTSRARLQLQAEHELPLGAFTVPDQSDIGQIADYPIISIFEERARQADPAFELTPDNLIGVIEICRRVDGLPLAVELAAARVRIMSTDEIHPRLQERPHLLSGGFQDVPHRHQTMRDAISWSYDLLDPEEQRLLRQLSVFVGGWTLDSALAVCRTNIDTVDGITTLRDSNLIERMDRAQAGSRFRMLETILQFALEELRGSGEYDFVRSVHARYCQELATRLFPDLLGPDPGDAMTAIETEMPNIRLALDWAHEDDPELGLDLCGSVSWYWLRLRGDISEARTLISRSLESTSVRSLARMRALSGLAWAAHMHYDSDVAMDSAREALEIARETGDDWYTAWLLHVLGRIAYFDQDPDEATRYAEESLQIARRIDDPWLIAWCFQLLGIARFIAGEPESARPHLETSYETWASINDEFGMAALSALLGVVTRMEGKFEPALELFQTSLSRYRKLGALWFASNFIAEIVALAANLGETERAAMLSGFVEEGWNQTGAGPAPFTATTFKHTQQVLRETGRLDEIARAHHQGQAMTLDEAITEALLVGTGT